MLRQEGWRVNHKRIERLWRREGLKVLQRQPKRRRLWLNDGSCIRLRPARKNHVWSYEFVFSRTHDGQPLRMLNVELFDTQLEARVLIERWHVHYNTVRLHCSLGYKPPAPEATLPRAQSSPVTRSSPKTCLTAQLRLRVVQMP